MKLTFLDRLRPNTRARAETASRARPTARPAWPERAPGGRHRLPEGRSGRYGERLAATTLFLVVVLSLIGGVMVLSASSVASIEDYGSPWFVFVRQAAWLVVGMGALYFVARMHYRSLRRFSGPFLVACLCLLVLALVPGIGVSVNGASRWVGFGFARIQPSEFTKLGLILFFAALLERRWSVVADARASIRPVLVVGGVVVALLMAQPNLGTTVIVGVILAAVLFVAGAPLKPLATIGLAAAAAATAAALAAPYRRARVTAFLDPWSDPGDAGYQTIQSLIGVSSGGPTGAGLGASRAKWGFLPFAHTDFIFSIIGEELGFVGSVAVVALFGGLGLVGFKIASGAPDPFGKLVATGITTWFGAQAFVNVGAVIGLLPITGVPLPFVSFGGSSLLCAMVAAGILISIARNIPDRPDHRETTPTRRPRPGRTPVPVP